jgi:hypothetical protein
VTDERQLLRHAVLQDTKVGRSQFTHAPCLFTGGDRHGNGHQVHAGAKCGLGLKRRGRGQHGDRDKSTRHASKYYGRLMPTLTRTVGFLLILLGVAGYVATGAVSITALIPAFFGAILLILAMVARNPNARKHAMHAALALALLGVLGTAPRIFSAINGGNISRPATLAQIAMAVVLLVYIALGVKSFIDARRARG